MQTPPRKPGRSRRRRTRASLRDEGHQAAQEAAESAPRSRIPDHPLIPADEPQLVESDEDLARVVAHVRDEGSFAYDTEFIGEETYHPRFCLIQVATTRQVALVDPLAGLDVTPIWELIADPDIETIVHAGQQDLEPVVRFLDRAPARIFDTQIVAGFVNRPYPLGLRQLVEEFIGIKLGKALTFTRWDKRPLSKVHARYAADDVRYLPAVRAALREELAALDHVAWAEDECATMGRVEAYRFDPDARMARMLSNQNLKPKRMAVLREMIILRDEVARSKNQPPRTVLKDEVLVRVARLLPRTGQALGEVKGMPWPLVDARGEAMLDAIGRAMELPPEQLPRARTSPETPADRVRIDSLWALVCAYCHGRSISPALVGNRARVAEYYFQVRRGEVDPDGLFCRGWRREVVGCMLDEMRGGAAAVELTWLDGRLESRTRSSDPRHD